MAEEIKRDTVRLRMDKNNGSVILKRRDIGPASGTLLDLSEAGCRFLLPASSDAAASAALSEAVKTGEVIHAEITFPPHLAFLSVQVEIRSAAPNAAGRIEAGCIFKDLSADDRAALSKAML